MKFLPFVGFFISFALRLSVVAEPIGGTPPNIKLTDSQGIPFELANCQDTVLLLYTLGYS